MFFLFLILHLFIGATLSGAGVVIVLLSGLSGAGPLAAVILSGFLLAFPVAKAVARSMRGE